jgi:hypothetical protein
MIGRICSAIERVQKTHMTQPQTERMPDKACSVASELAAQAEGLTSSTWSIQSHATTERAGAQQKPNKHST